MKVVLVLAFLAVCAAEQISFMPLIVPEAAVDVAEAVRVVESPDAEAVRVVESPDAEAVRAVEFPEEHYRTFDVLRKPEIEELFVEIPEDQAPLPINRPGKQYDNPYLRRH